MLSLVSSVRPV